MFFFSENFEIWKCSEAYDLSLRTNSSLSLPFFKILVVLRAVLLKLCGKTLKADIMSFIMSPKSMSRPLPDVFLYFAADIYISWRCRFNACMLYTLTVYPGCLSQGVREKMILTLTPSPLLVSDFNLCGRAEWQPLLSPCVTVVEISLRGSMQISSEDVDKQWWSRGSDRQTRGRREDDFLWALETHKHTKDRYTCVSLMEFAGNLVSHFDSQRI